MFARLLFESFRRQRRRKAFALLAIALGMSIATAMIAVANDTGDKMNQELRTYSANLVLTRDRGWFAHGVIVVHSVSEALAQAGASAELVAIGGAEIYRLLLPLARRIYLTHVHADVPGDITFPEFDSTQWADVECSTQPADEKHAYPLTFVTLERRYAPETPWQH